MDALSHIRINPFWVIKIFQSIKKLKPQEKRLEIQNIILEIHNFRKFLHQIIRKFLREHSLPHVYSLKKKYEKQRKNNIPPN